MGTLSLAGVLAQNSTAIRIPDGGTTASAVSGLLAALLVTGILLAIIVPAVRRERWPLVALIGLLILGTQAGVLFCLTQILASPPV